MSAIHKEVKDNSVTVDQSTAQAAVGPRPADKQRKFRRTRRTKRRAVAAVAETDKSIPETGILGQIVVLARGHTIG